MKKLNLEFFRTNSIGYETGNIPSASMVHFDILKDGIKSSITVLFENKENVNSFLHELEEEKKLKFSNVKGTIMG